MVHGLGPDSVPVPLGIGLSLANASVRVAEVMSKMAESSITMEHLTAEDRHTMSVAFQGHGIAGANLMSYLVGLDVRNYRIEWPEGFDVRWMDRESDLKKEIKCLQDESLRTKGTILCDYCMATIPEAQPVQLMEDIPMVICPSCVKGVCVCP